MQGYFTRRVERIARTHGRRIVGWDDIVAGGVTPSAIVMAWHGVDAGLSAIRRGHDVVMTPDPPLYFDAYQGNPRYEPLAIGGLTTLQMVYAFDPMPPGLTRAERRHVLGAQGNLWTEYVPTPAQLDYMLLPRALALAEVCWTPRARMRWGDFEVRVGAELARLDARHVRYRVPNVTFAFAGDVSLAEQQTTPNAIEATTSRPRPLVALADLAPHATIRYTLDGTLPTAASRAYAGPLRVRMNAAGATLAAVAIVAGRTSAPSFLHLDATAP